MDNEHEEKMIAAAERRNAEKIAMRDGGVDARVRSKMADDPVFQDQVLNAWILVVSSLEDRASNAKPTPKNFEVHHERLVCRDAFLISLDADGDVEKAKRIALERTAPNDAQVAPQHDEAPAL